jgi:hypothetical protein
VLYNAWYPPASQARQKLVALVFQTFYDLCDAEWLASEYNRQGR